MDNTSNSPNRGLCISKIVNSTAVNPAIPTALPRDRGTEDHKAMGLMTEVSSRNQKSSSDRENSSVILVRDLEHVSYIIYTYTDILFTDRYRQASNRPNFTRYFSLGQSFSKFSNEEEARNG